jgi:hypothetical protein
VGIETALIGAGISAAGSIASGIMGADAASSAADAQAQAAANSTALQKQMFDKQVELQAPFRTGGLTAQNRLLTLLGLNPNTTTSDGSALPAGLNVDANSADFGKYARDFNMSDFQADPGYAFRLAEGNKALNASAAARGGMISGNALTAAQNYGQQAGSQEYQNAYNRYQTNRANQLQPLQSLMGVGQTSANALTNAAGAYGAAAGSNALAAGNALASGQIGAANAWNGAFGNIGKAFNSSFYNSGSSGGSNSYGGFSSQAGLDNYMANPVYPPSNPYA